MGVSGGPCGQQASRPCHRVAFLTLQVWQPCTNSPLQGDMQAPTFALTSRSSSWKALIGRLVVRSGARRAAGACSRAQPLLMVALDGMVARAGMLLDRGLE